MGRAHEVRAASMAKTAAAKSKVYNKHAKELYMAAKSGVPDPEMNVVLKRTIEKAKKDQVPADVIKRAIEKAKGGSDENYTASRYEGFSHGNSMIMVDCLSDNANRTFSNIRNIFNKTGSKLGVAGCVAHMFNNQAVFAFSGLTDEETLDILITADCEVDDVSLEDGEVSVYAPQSEYFKIKTALTEAKSDIQFTVDETTYVPAGEYVKLEGDDLSKFQRLLDLLDEDDDVQDVYHNVELPIVEE